MTFSVTPDSYGRYIADASNPMLVKEVVDEHGVSLDASKYVVVYFTDVNDDGKLDASDTVALGSNGVYGSYPKAADNYVAVVVPDADWKALIAADAGGTIFDENGNIKAASAWSAFTTGVSGAAIDCYKAQGFRIATAAAETKSLEGAFAFELDGNELNTNAADRTDFADTTMKYLGKQTLTGWSSSASTGNSIKVAFSANDEQVIEGTDYKVVWSVSDSSLSAPALKGDTGKQFYEITNAKPATYTATLYGINNYAGSETTVTFSVDPIDLSKDTIAVETQESTSGFELASSVGGDVIGVGDNYKKITVNGEPLIGTSNIDMVATKFEGLTGETVYNPVTGMSTNIGAGQIKTGELGIYDFKFAPEYNAAGNPYVVGSSQSAQGLVVTNAVNFYYNGQPAKSELAKGFVNGTSAFDPELLSANTGAYNAAGTESEFTYKVTKDGTEVTSYDEPGTYVVTLDSAVTAGFASAGHEVVTFTVSDPVVNIVDRFFQVDGKAIDGTFYYTGETYDVDVVAYDGKKNVLTEGKDYTVAIYDEDGNEVDTMVDAGDYKIYVTAVGAKQAAAADATFTISAAPIESAKADQAFYAYTGETVVPTFTGYTEDDLTGLSVALNADNAKITYKKSSDNTDGNYVDISADQVKDAGYYEATIVLPAGFKNFTNKAAGSITVKFRISEQVAFSDVAADAWYAEAVYTAAQDGSAVGSTVTDFRYMTGIEGTKLFMPEALITRAEVAQVFFNMAGGEKDAAKEYPTKFADVDQAAWYAQAISWASTAGVVGGYDDGVTFGTFDNATREQVATMIYRYAKAQGLDVTVEDEAAALAKYADGSSVSEYAKQAMAWCVEQGVFGVGVDSLRPQDNLTRAEMAATAVRVQPDGRKQAL